MKKIIATDLEHLKSLIKDNINANGNDCSLNHIDVSKITDMTSLFNGSKFNGDISSWDVSNVKNMEFMFSGSAFNGDISKWNVSKVEDMEIMFYDSKFTQDLSQWTPFNLELNDDIFKKCKSPIPYWAEVDIENIKDAIDKYIIHNKLSLYLKENNKTTKLKI